MVEKSKEEIEQPDFAEIYAEYPDKEIIAILKKRKHYQEKAAKQAILEAIKRGLIHSEQDLFAEEYKVEPLKFSLIPTIENDTAANKIQKSLSRSLMILGLVPIIWGIIKIVYGNSLEGSLLVILGFIWSYICYKQIKNIKPVYLNLLSLLLGGAVIYVWFNFAKRKGFPFMDIMVVGIVFGFVVYALLFLRKLYHRN
jgi:hypothetical protein